MKKIIASAAISFAAAKAIAGGVPTKEIQPFENYYGVISAGISKSMKVGGDFDGSDMGKSVITGLGIKTDINENIKFGLNLDYRPSYKVKHAESDGGDTVVSKDKYKIAALMFTADYEFNNFDDVITPYLQVGAGMSRVSSPVGTTVVNNSTTFSTTKKTKSQFAYSAGLGVKYKLSNDIALGMGYKFSHFGKLDNDLAGTTATLNAKHLRSNDITASLEYKF